MSRIGIKQRVANVLSAPECGALTIGEIIARIEIDKTLAGEVSSALHKLRNQGLIQSFVGPASSSMGRRYVKRYKWVVKKQIVLQATPPADNPIRWLPMTRI